MGRAPCCDKANVKRGPWSPEEDEKLKSYIEKHGTGGNWIALPHKIGLKRCGKSCRLRWLNYLRPNIRHGGFTEDEDNLICGLYIAIGSRWSIIAAQLPGRTDNDIKNYWNTKLKKKLLGKQRRQKQTKKAETGKGDQAYPQMPQLVLPPCLVQSRYSDSVDSSSLPPVDEELLHNHLQLKNNRGKVGNFLYTSDGPCPPSQHLCNNSEVVLSPSIPLMESDLYGAYDEITRDGLSPLHAIDLMICRTGMFSPEIIGKCGDADSIIQRYGLSDEDGLQRIMPQNWEFTGDS